ncbi:MAG: molybdopterin molybdotransferase MoeA [Parvibaculaceae bacterium]|nr:molybdopterin molybdotransferase MoeA [Parvibaculaceae bacterium]
MSALLPVEDAIARLGSTISPLGVETMSLAQANGRVLAHNVVAQRTQPPFDNSAMDGYAVRAADITSVPTPLQVIGEAPAGGTYEGVVENGQAVRIFTGGPIPHGADAIVIQEDTQRDGSQVTILETSLAGRHIRRAGLDFSKGDVCLKAGERLTPYAISLAAAANVPELSVYRQPRVAFFATGNELVLPGQTPGPHQIVSSNSAGIAAFILAHGGVPVDLGIARDTLDSIKETAFKAKDADLLLTLGGASVGDHDLVQKALVEIGLTVDFWKIAMRPGKPLMFGDLNGQPFLGLPGNPVSALVCAILFLSVAMARLSGLPAKHPAHINVQVDTDLPENGPRQDYIRAGIHRDETGLLIATPVSRQDSSMLSSMAASGGLIIRAPHAPALRAGSTVPLLPLKLNDF